MSEQLIIYVATAIAVGLPVYLFLRRGGWLGTAPANGSRFQDLGEEIRLRDLFRLAVVIEEEGYNFYLKMAKRVRDEKTKELCNYLAEEETRHRQLFLELLNHWNPLDVNPYTWPAFLERVKKEGLFGTPPAEDDEVDEMASYAILQEIKSAEFYKMFEVAFPEAWKRARLHRLVLEERSHEAKLREAYPRLNPKN